MKIKLLFTNYQETHEYFGTPEEQMKFHKKAFDFVLSIVSSMKCIPSFIRIDGNTLKLDSVEKENDDGVRFIYYHFKGSGN